ncbi:multicopper oxidase-domain-containing protein [Hypoxylon sp. FL0890]|nr:multicopper oxidase-domain-containing protein [Hypoxylon sp. FL0890]
MVAIKKYQFRCEYGHGWYHSHFALQVWNGVFGGILVNGLCSVPCVEDKGVLLVNDWFHNTTDALWSTASTGSPPVAQNGLINGINIYGDGGKKFETTFAAGKRHRIRSVNAAIGTHFKFMIDNHKMKVMAVDLVPIQPLSDTLTAEEPTEARCCYVARQRVSSDRIHHGKPWCLAHALPYRPHASQGFGLQVVELEAEIPNICDTSSIDSTCAKWQRYVAAKGILQEDSGI